MGQALYRKYRSKSFDEVIGQDPITSTLRNAIDSGRISHAYLLSGPRGVGKTSVARILAHEVNDLPYTDESIHLDIIEIDAASNRRIDEIRDIRQKVHIAPTSAKYKVYIIDEVHMLTKEAFNALLKTLEEPPAHCIFILATTEPHKLPETIISRTQRFNFKPIAQNEAVAELKKIAKTEKIDIEPAALELLASYSEGSFRDSLSMLDQLSGAGGTVSEDSARQLLGLPPSDSISKLIEFIERGDFKAVVNLLTQLKEAGNNPIMVSAQLGRMLRSQMLVPGTPSPKWSSVLLKNLLDVSSAKHPYELLEVTLLQSAFDNSSQMPGTIAKPAATIKNPSPAPVEEPDHETRSTPISRQKSTGLSMDIWPEAQEVIKKRAASIYTALRLAQPEIEGNTVTLTFQFPLHKNKVEQARHIQLISDVLGELSGKKVEVKCTLSKKFKKQSKTHVPTPSLVAEPKSSELTTISNIFGSAEVLES
ncbi:DNA polymerase III subunit gamma/tau [Candidatus Saccharibacteria bacterium]|nr:DNA polymerase III subunit gamma/tau [Candidatus Saccharibacteria bacterium]